MTSNPWQLLYTQRAQRDLRRLDRQVAKRVVLAIERLANEDQRSDVRKMSAGDEYRLRVGEWRVRFRRDSTPREIVVLRALPRGRAYKR